MSGDEWFKSWFMDPAYLTVYRHRDESEAKRLLDLIERTLGHHPDWKVLDLACGAGRHTIALAERGYKNLTGFDLSSTLLDEAASESGRKGLSIRFIEGDMRHLPFKDEYDLVLNLFTSFGYFSDANNELVLKGVVSALKQGGSFVMDYLNAEHVRSTLAGEDTRKLETGESVTQRRTINGKRIEKEIEIERDGMKRVFHESVRLYDKDELIQLFNDVGLTVNEVLGSYDGDAYTAASPRVILFATKS